LFYYSGQCNSSAENLKQIQENFVKALNNSVYKAACLGNPNCRAEYVSISCGEVSGRRKRSIEYAYVIQLEIWVPFKRVVGQDDSQLFTETKSLLYDIADVIADETVTGHFDLDGLTVRSDSFAGGQVQYSCPRGTATQSSASCGNSFMKQSLTYVHSNDLYKHLSHEHLYRASSGTLLLHTSNKLAILIRLSRVCHIYTVAYFNADIMALLCTVYSFVKMNVNVA